MTDTAGILKTVSDVLQRAANHTGAVTALSALGVFGLVAIFDLGVAQYAALASFGFMGAYEVARRQAAAVLQKRCQDVGDDTALLLDIQTKYPTCNPKIFKELRHHDVIFNVIGFDKLQIPLAVTGPLCPACGGHLAERTELRLTLRPRITLVCLCGHIWNVPRTKAEMLAELRKIAGTPQ